jgi:tetratricopeptide (TPR) repeat protein
VQGLRLTERARRAENEAGRFAGGVAMSCVRAITILAAGWVALGGGAAGAEGNRQLDEARAHFQAGQRAYGEARFDEALREFEAGYALSPRPEFLLNFAQTDRKLGRTDEAIEQCQRFLAAAPDSPLAPEARHLLQALREERAAAPPARAAEKDVRAPAIAPAAPAIAPAAVPVVVSPAPARSAAPRRTWIWITAGAVAVVAIGLGVGLGVGLSPTNTYPHTALVASFGR